MKNRSSGLDKRFIYRLSGIIICILLNVVFSYLANRFDLPLYFDAIGTVLISFVGGAFPGIITAVSTNFACSIFYSDSMYYAFVGVLIAIATAWFTKQEKYKKKTTIVYLIITLSLIGGVIGMIFQWLLLGEPQFDYVADTARVMAGDSGILYFLSSTLLLFGLNIVDKGISVIIAVAVFWIIPEKIRFNIRNSGWKQSPLTQKEIKNINSIIKKGFGSLRFRIILILFLATLALTVVLGVVSVRLNYENEKKEGLEQVVNAAELTSKLLDCKYFDEFLRRGTIVSEYGDSQYIKYNNELLALNESFPGLESLCVYEIRQEDCYVIFDTSEDFQKSGRIGEKGILGEQYKDNKPDFVAGNDIPVKEIRTQYGIFLEKIMPMKDANGNTTHYYIAATINMKQSDNFIRGYIIKGLMVFSGFLALSLAFGFWLSDYYLIYPIGSLEKSIDGFMKGIDDQEKLDESVKNLQKLNIRTNDEVEKLYNSICEMGYGTAEHMRNIRMLAKSNEKMQSGLIITMADMVENRDSDTGAHVQKTAAYVRIILEGLRRNGYYSEKLTDKYISDVIMSAPLHDIGKISVPDSVLNKPGKLTAEEYEIIKTHTTAGKKILENAINKVEGESYLKEARNMAAYHHERWDGKGYPEGLHGQVIPLSARVMAVADVFDALASPRVYKPAFPIEKALEIIEEGSGTQFDPKCVEVFMESITEVKSVLKKYQEA